MARQSGGGIQKYRMPWSIYTGGKMERRQYVRTSMDGMTVYICDEDGLCGGTLKDISRFGVCITDIPRKLQIQNGSFDAVIHGAGYSFKLHLQEKWKVRKNQTTMVGAVIDSAPRDWAEMTLRNEIRIGTVL